MLRTDLLLSLMPFVSGTGRSIRNRSLTTHRIRRQDGHQVSDLSPLKGMKLHELQAQNTPVSDLTPLQGMPLEDIRLTPKNITNEGLDILRAMKSLKTIGNDWNQVWPAAKFWTRYDKGEFQ